MRDVSSLSLSSVPLLVSMTMCKYCVHVPTNATYGSIMNQNHASWCLVPCALCLLSLPFASVRCF
jgi:hypothetical protein